MRPFNHVNPKSLEEATELLLQDGTVAVAGSGDIIPALKDNIFPEYPKTVVNLKTIPGLKGIRLNEAGDTLIIGALVTLAEISRSETVRETAPALAAAAGGAAAPNLRETATIGGNICQMPRCWYYRKLNNRFNCARKGGERCFALTGDNRYHSVFGTARECTPASNDPRTAKPCIAVNGGDLAPVLTAIAAKVVTTRREGIPMDAFCTAFINSSTCLAKGEIIKEIHIPVNEYTKNCRYKRFAFRKSIDFPIINVAIAKGTLSGKADYRIIIGGAAPIPYWAGGAMALLSGTDEITPELAEKAGTAAVSGAKPTEANAYKLQLIRTLVKRELLKFRECD